MSASVTLNEFAGLVDVIGMARLPPGPANDEAALLSINELNPVADAPLAKLARASALLGSVAPSDALAVSWVGTG